MLLPSPRVTELFEPSDRQTLSDVSEDGSDDLARPSSFIASILQLSQITEHFSQAVLILSVFGACMSSECPIFMHTLACTVSIHILYHRL